jgi:hypothetical protein
MNNSSFAGRARRAALLRGGVAIAALHFGLCASASATVIYTSAGFDEAKTCASSSDCVRSGRVADERQGSTEVASGFSLAQDMQVTGFSWIGDHFDGDNFVLRLYAAVDGQPATNPLYEYAIGTQFTATPLVPSPGFLSGWQLSADLTPLVLAANTSYYASLSSTSASTSGLAYSWDNGKNHGSTTDFRRDDQAPGEWQSASGPVAAYQLSGTPVSVPEPTTLALLVPGGIALLWLTRRRRKES